jgi:cytochrome P450
VPYLFPAAAEERVELEDLFQHLSRWILMKDPPEHSRLRNAMNPGFSRISSIERLVTGEPSDRSGSEAGGAA